MRSMELKRSVDGANASLPRRFFVERAQQVRLKVMMHLQALAKTIVRKLVRELTLGRSKVPTEFFVEARPKLRTCRLGHVESLKLDATQCEKEGYSLDRPYDARHFEGIHVGRSG